MHSRGLQALEQRYALSGNWYLAPSADPWARKLGAAASLTQQDPGPIPPPPNWTVDDGDANYSDVGGTWTRELNPLAIRRRRSPAPGPAAGLSDDARLRPCRHGCSTNVTPGWYYIQATWVAAPDQATDAQYHCSTTATPCWARHRPISRSRLPVRPMTMAVVAGLGDRYIRNGSVLVQLNGQATGFLVADGMRLVPVENDVEVLSLDEVARQRRSDRSRVPSTSVGAPMMSMPLPPPGFTLLEVTLVSGLMAVLVLVISAAWIGVGQPSPT